MCIFVLSTWEKFLELTKKLSILTNFVIDDKTLVMTEKVFVMTDEAFFMGDKAFVIGDKAIGAFTTR